MPSKSQRHLAHLLKKIAHTVCARVDVRARVCVCVHVFVCVYVHVYTWFKSQRYLKIARTPRIANLDLIKFLAGFDYHFHDDRFHVMCVCICI